MSDFISRRMMLDKMISRKSLFSTNQYEYMALSEVDKARADEIDNCIADLRNAPDAEPERKKGKWMSHYDYCQKHDLLPTGLVAFWWCDQCEEAVEHPTNFCPHCGAEMKRGE